MKPEDSAWQNLVSAARRVRDDRDTAAPFGFSTRLAALAMAAERTDAVSLFERFSWRALALAALLAATSIATSYPSLASTADDDVLSNDTAVAALFETS